MISSFVLNTSQSIKDFGEEVLLRWRYPSKIIPPARIRRAGKTIDGYIRGGEQQRKWITRFGRCTPQTHLLDIGCGDGRLASALTEYLTTGSYSTFEVNRDAVIFLQKTIGKKYPGFSFLHADVYHSYYNKKGKDKTTTYRFPYPDQHFDLVFLNSIFTHFLPQDVALYLSEIRRVLKPKGIVVATYFIANKDSVSRDKQGTSEADLLLGRKQLLNFRVPHAWVRDHDIKEQIVALDESWLRAAHKKAGLTIDRVVWGTWCGRKQTAENTQQDVVISRILV